jgi:hypothetical protein
MDEKYWGEKGTEIYRLFLGNAWNRGGLLLLAGGIAALTGWGDQVVKHLLGGKWPDVAEHIGWILIALGIAMLAVGAYKAKAPNPSDTALIRKFRKIFTVGQVDFLQNHNFQANWHDSYVQDIEDIADGWNNAQHEFVDKKLNKLLITVKELSREFANLENKGFNIHPGQPVRTLKTEPDLHNLSAQTKARMDQLTNVARKLADAANELERTARKRLPDA